MVVTRDTFQPPISWLNGVLKNMRFIEVTELVSQPLTFLLNGVLSNIPSIAFTELVSQPLMSVLNCVPLNRSRMSVTADTSHRPIGTVSYSHGTSSLHWQLPDVLIWRHTSRASRRRTSGEPGTAARRRARRTRRRRRIRRKHLRRRHARVLQREGCIRHRAL